MARTGSHVGSFVPPGPHSLAPVGRTLLMGRWEAAHVVVVDQMVSTLHAAIIAVDGRWQLRDLGSRNGTFVNGARITEVFLRTGDVIKVGNTIFRFELASHADETPPSAVRRTIHLDPRATIGFSMPADPAEALLSGAVQEPRAVSALLNLSNMVDLDPPRQDLIHNALSMIADSVGARSVSLWRAEERPQEGDDQPRAKQLAQEAAWGEEKAERAARDELIAHATVRRQATTSTMGEAGFGAAIPLLARRSHLGALYVERAAPFQRRDVELLSIFSTKLALAIENDDLNDQLRRTNAHLEAEVARRTADVERLSEQRRDLLGMVAHDVRGSLTFVKLLADPQALVTEGAKDPVALQALEQIGLRAGKTIELLGSLLDTQSLEEGTIEIRHEDVDLVALVRALIVPLDRWAKGKKLDLVLDAKAPVKARTDPARVEQVIQNLVANAIKNTRHGSITVSLTSSGGRARVSISDTGHGIPPDVLAQIFKPVKTKDATGRPRVGLGLAIAHRLVTLMGGKISVVSNPEMGTRFEFDLPSAS